MDMQTLRASFTRAEAARTHHFRETAVLVAGLMLAPSCRDGNASLQPTAPSSSSAMKPVHVDSLIGNSNGCPRMMVRIEGYCIDRYEAHVVELASDNSWRPHPHYLPVTGIRVMAKSAPGVFPQGYINQPEAENACLEAGKRLCKAKEWEKACLGPDDLRFTYGKVEEPNKCNTRKEHLLSILFGTDREKWTLQNFNDPALNSMPGFLGKTDEFRLCVSGYGVFNMVGNLAEWTSGKVTSDDDLVPMKGGAKSPHMTKIGNGIFMGSFYSNSNELGSGCFYVTTGHEPTYHDYSTGFRCCKDAK